MFRIYILNVYRQQIEFICRRNSLKYLLNIKPSLLESQINNKDQMLQVFFWLGSDYNRKEKKKMR